MGFNTLHGMVTNANEAMVNYGDVGFGLISDTRLVPLMHLEIWGIPILGLRSMSDLVISLLLLMVLVLALHRGWRRHPG